jgi:hypothetical protein
MSPQFTQRGHELIPRHQYVFLSIWLAILKIPYKNEILWEIRWGFRREYKKRRSIKGLYQRHSTDYWFQREVVSAFGNALLMRINSLVSVLMALIKIV